MQVCVWNGEDEEKFAGLESFRKKTLTYLVHLIFVQSKHTAHKSQHLVALVSGGMKISQVKILH